MKSKPLSKSPHCHREPEPCLRFTPTAWAKLLCLRDATDAEVGGFGLSDAEDLLLVRDILLVKQEVSSVTVAFDDAAVADLFEDLVAAGCHPEQFARLWMHTHPGSSPLPSSTDEGTFQRVFGECHWSVMFILARTGQTYARLRFGVGPGGGHGDPRGSGLQRALCGLGSTPVAGAVPPAGESGGKPVPAHAPQYLLPR